VLDGVKSRALGEHPAGENPLHLACKLHLVDFDERRGMGRLGGRSRVANPRGHLERPELDRLVHGYLEMRDAPRHLVEGSEDRDGVLDRVGVGKLNRAAERHSQGNCKNETTRGNQTVGGQTTPLDHAAHFMNGLPNSRSGGLILSSMIALKTGAHISGITLEHQTPLP
jgi:hypothetical protein